jgi:hypothetical protein
MDLGSLKKLLEFKGKLPEIITLYITKEIIKGLNFLQNHKILH